MRSIKGEGDQECQSCGLLAPRAHMRVWRRRRLCRALHVMGRERAPAEPEGEAWVSGLYRYYYVTHEDRVCPVCFDHLEAGGEFSGGLRRRSRVAFLVLLVIVVLLIVSFPVLLPLLKSALWLEPEEGN